MTATEGNKLTPSVGKHLKVNKAALIAIPSREAMTSYE
jgi:hypothetical protein